MMYYRYFTVLKTPAVLVLYPAYIFWDQEELTLNKVKILPSLLAAANTARITMSVSLESMLLQVVVMLFLGAMVFMMSGDMLLGLTNTFYKMRCACCNRTNMQVSTFHYMSLCISVSLA